MAKPRAEKLRRRQHRRAPAALQHVGDLRHAREGAADARELVHRLRRLDEQAVGAGLEVELGAAQRLVEAVHRAGIGAGDDEGVGIAPRGGGRPQLGRHNVGVDHLLAGHVAAALGRALVLDEDRRHAHRLVARDRARDVLGVAIAVVAVDQHRQLGRRHDVADAGAHLAETDQPEIRQPVTRADQRKAADRIGGKARALDQPRRERVMRAGQQQRALALQQLLPCRSCLHGVHRRRVGLHRRVPARRFRFVTA